MNYMNQFQQNPMGLAGFLNQRNQQQTAQNQPQPLPIPELSQNWTNPFTTASAGVKSDGTPNNMNGLALQDFLNRSNQSATNALYGGLMNYQPQSMRVGSANADYAYNSTPPTTDPQGLLSALSQGFGSRSWGNPSMGKMTPQMTPQTSPMTPKYNSREEMPQQLQQQLVNMETNKNNALQSLMASNPSYFANLKRNK